MQKIVFNKRLLGYSVLLLLLFSPSILLAQTIVTDRPDQTEASLVIPKNTYQLEIGAQFGEIGLEEHRENYILAPTSLIRIGLSNWIELRIVGQYLTATSSENAANKFDFGDVEIGAKVQLLRNENINTEIAFISHLIVPVGATNLTNGQLGVVNKLSIGHDLSERVSLGYNLGYNNFGVGNGVATYSLAIGFALTEKLGFYLEPYGDWIEFNQHLANFDGGFTYLLKDNLQLDISSGFGLNYHMYYVSTGLSWNFNPRN